MMNPNHEHLTSLWFQIAAVDPDDDDLARIERIVDERKVLGRNRTFAAIRRELRDTRAILEARRVEVEIAEDELLTAAKARLEDVLGSDRVVRFAPRVIEGAAGQGEAS